MKKLFDSGSESLACSFNGKATWAYRLCSVWTNRNLCLLFTVCYNLYILYINFCIKRSDKKANEICLIYVIFPELRLITLKLLTIKL